MDDDQGIVLKLFLRKLCHVDDTVPELFLAKCVSFCL